jgi:hypothetical protein
MASVGSGCFTPPFKYNFQLYHPKLKKTSSHLLILLVKTDVFLSNRKIKKIDYVRNIFFSGAAMGLCSLLSQEI